MISFISWICVGALAIWFIVAFITEPRRLRTGVLPFAVLLALILALATSPAEGANRATILLVLALVVLAFVGYEMLIPFLLVNGIIVLRREEDP